MTQREQEARAERAAGAAAVAFLATAWESLEEVEEALAALGLRHELAEASALRERVVALWQRFAA